MADSEVGSSSDAAQVLGGEYEVFLSFRGSDTRYGFTDFLYCGLVDAGVCVFRDDDELRVGEVIGGSLLRAINSSKIYIPIFSQTYASSKWCLRELAHIIDIASKSDDEKSIVPIFFDVEIDDVKLKTPLYSYALLEHEKKFPLEVQAWRAALAAVAKMKGWLCKNDQSQAAIVNSIVEKVLKKLKVKQKIVTEHLVGLDDTIKDLMELLDVNHPGVRLIGIYGMGGIGKTTVAKVIFNRLLSHYGKRCSFLEDVRERLTKDGIVPLQKKLLSDIDDSGSVEEINDSEEGMRRIEAMLSKEKMKDEVQALHMDGLDDSIEITNEDLERLLNLRFLKLGNGTFVGDFLACRSLLRWISWCSPHQDFRAKNLYFDHLVVFKLDKNGFTDDSEAWNLIKRMKKMEDEAGEQAAVMETAEWSEITSVRSVVGSDDCVEEITNSPEMEVNDESIEKIEDEAGQRTIDMGTLDRNYAIAAVQNIVGIDDHAKQITDLMEMEVDDEVRIIGIYGADGIGKTTLAKAIYKHISSCFDSCSFLTEVEETTQNPQWFGPGSRIIVTSQDEEILKEFDSDKARRYTVSELDDGQAFESFCKHAFRMQSSIPDYDGLSKRIVNATGKLPLAVEVIGSFLRGKSVQEWEKMENSIKARTMNSQKTSVGLEDILDICYKGLDQRRKHISGHRIFYLWCGCPNCFIYVAQLLSILWLHSDAPGKNWRKQ